MKKGIVLAVLSVFVLGSFMKEKREQLDFNGIMLMTILNNNKEPLPEKIPAPMAMSVRSTWFGGKLGGDTVRLYSNYVKAVKTHCQYTNYIFNRQGRFNRHFFNTCEGQFPAELENKQENVTYSILDKDDVVKFVFEPDDKSFKETYRVALLERVYYNTKTAGYEITLIKQAAN